MRIFAFFVLIVSFASFAYTKEDVTIAGYLAEKDIIPQQSTIGWYRLDESITRAEVIGIALKIRWIAIPAKYTCKNYFSDVSDDANNPWICPAVEIAADNKIISKNNKTFRPLASITRIEALGIIMRAVGVWLKPEVSINEKNISNDGTAAWQKDLLNSAYSKWIIEPISSDATSMKFGSEQKVTRYMVYRMVKNILPFQIEKKYTISFENICSKKPEGIQTASIGWKKTVLNLYPLPLKNAFSGSYVIQDNVITYVAKKISENDIILGTFIYQYDCATKKSKNISSSLVSGLHNNAVLEAVSDTYIVARIQTGEYSLPGSSIFYIYDLKEKKWIYVKGKSAKGIDKYIKSPPTRYITSIEKIRMNKGIWEAKIVIYDAGEKNDPTSIPDYKVISEKWVEIDLSTGSLK